ncbi:MAG: glutathione S-transferase family protein [Pseudomonadota bacterium]
MRPVIYGYRYSVYSWIVLLVMAEKGVVFDWSEVDPFDLAADDPFRRLNPLCRVPVLEHDGQIIYETAAVTQYIDDVFEGPALVPKDPGQRARMRQLICVADADAYWPLVRQVFVQSVWRPRCGETKDKDEVRSGLVAASRVLSALEDLVSEERYLVIGSVSLADLHLAPMISYFSEADEGRDLLLSFPRLSGWWSSVRGIGSFRETRPDLATAFE